MVDSIIIYACIIFVTKKRLYLGELSLKVNIFISKRRDNWFCQALSHLTKQKERGRKIKRYVEVKENQNLKSITPNYMITKVEL